LILGANDTEIVRITTLMAVTGQITATAGVDISASQAFSVAGTNILSDSTGTMTLSNVDALDATTEATIEAAIDTLANLTAAAALVTVGALNSGSITSGFGNIDNGSSNIITTAIEINGDLNHDGSNIGFFGIAPVARASAYTPTNVTTDRSYDANATSTDELADVLGTLISDLQAYGLLQ